MVSLVKWRLGACGSLSLMLGCQQRCDCLNDEWVGVYGTERGLEDRERVVHRLGVLSAWT